MATVVSAWAWLKPMAMIGSLPSLGELAQRLLALGVVLDFELAIFRLRLLLELLGALEGRLVEGFVVLAAEVVDDRRLRGERRGRAEGQGRRRSDHDTFHLVFLLRSGLHQEIARRTAA